jgi:hypothetical protein
VGLLDDVQQDGGDESGYDGDLREDQQAKEQSQRSTVHWFVTSL